MWKKSLICVLYIGFASINAIHYLCGAPSLSSDLPITYDTKKQCSVAEGNAEFINKDLCLQSDRIYYFAENAKALAEGNVRITNSQLRVKTEAGSFINATHALSADRFCMEVQGQGITGENLRGTTEHLTADNVFIDYNSSENKIAGVNIKARKGELHGHEYFELYDAAFHIGKLPVFYTPYYRHDFNRSTLRLKSDVGMIRRNKEFGRYIRNDLLFDFGRRVKPGIMFDYYRKRDYLVGGILEYNESLGKGFFKAARIHDTDLDAHVGADPFLKNARYFMEWRHQGHLNEQTDVVAQVEWMRDKNFIKDFRPDENDGARQHPDNFAEISHRTENSVTSVLARYRFNHFQQIQERLPEVRFDYLPVRLADTPLYYQYGFGISFLRENPRRGVNGQPKDLHRLDTSFGINMPLNPCSWCTFTPVFGTRILNYWGLKSENKNKYTRFLNQIGFDLRFRAYGDYTYENDYWNIHNFRHLLQPVIQYRYIPHGHQGDSFLTPIDREALEGRKVSLQSIDLLNRRDVDDFNDMHMVRLGVENFLYTNYAQGNPQQWMHFNIYQDVRLKKINEDENLRKTLSDTFFDFEWSPASFFSLNQYLRFDPTEKRLRESETSLTLKENDLWSLTCSHTYLQGDRNNVNNQNSLSLSYRINSKNVVSAAISVNAHTPDLIRQTYTWSTIIAKTWNLDFIFEWKKRPRPLRANTKESWNVRFVLTFIEW